MEERRNFNMKKNIGATLALYPSPVIVVGAMVDGKPNWTLVAHAGTVDTATLWFPWCRHTIQTREFARIKYFQ